VYSEVLEGDEPLTFSDTGGQWLLHETEVKFPPVPKIKPFIPYMDEITINQSKLNSQPATRSLHVVNKQ